MTGNIAMHGTVELRRRLSIFDDPGLEAFCMDYFPQVYDKFSRGLRLDEKVNLLLDHCRRNEADYERLRKLIRSDDDILSDYPAIPLPPRPYFAHPYALQTNFTGRVTERQMLTDWLTSIQHSVFVLVAMGGMGKSSLTWYWLQNDVDLTSFEGILWWSFYEGEASFSRFLDEALIYVTKGGINPNTLTSDYDKVRILTNLLQEQRILLILDGFERQLRAYAGMNAVYQGNVVDETSGARVCTSSHASQFLQILVAGLAHAKVLITTRLMIHDLEDRTGSPLAHCEKMELDALYPDDAVAFMRAQGVTKGTDTEIRTLCDLYGAHPLSLRLLSGLIVRDRKNPGDVAVAFHYDVHTNLIARQHHVLETAYNTLSLESQALLSQMAAFRHAIDYESLGIFDILGSKPETPISHQRILGAKPVQPILTAIRHLFGRQFKESQDDSKLRIEEYSQHLNSHPEIDLALNELVACGLVSFDESRKRFDLHPVVRAYAYERLKNPKDTHLRLRDYFVTQDRPFEQIRAVDDLFPVIELYHHTLQANYPAEAWELYDTRLRAFLYYYLGIYKEDIHLLNELLEKRELLQDVRDQTWLLLYLSMDYERIGQLQSALELTTCAVDLNSNLDVWADWGSSLVALASVNRNLGQLHRAVENGSEAAALMDRIGDANWCGISHRNYAHTLISCGNLVEANHQLNIAIHAYTTDERNFVHGLSRSWLYRSQILEQNGELARAWECANKAYELSSYHSPPYILEATNALYQLGKLCYAMGQYEDAEFNLQKALNACRRMSLADSEPNVLLWLARVRYKNVDSDPSIADEAHMLAIEALSLADRCGYRLKQADIHNFLAQWNLDMGNASSARKHAEIAKERAWCDGPPYSYQVALDNTFAN